MVVVRYWGETEPPWQWMDVPWIVRLGVRWGITMLALLVAAALVTGVNIDGWRALLPAAAIFLVVRAILRPLLIILTCPLEILTLGLFVVIVNALVFAFTAWVCHVFGTGFHVDGFWAALLGSLVVSGVYFLATIILRPGRRRPIRRLFFRETPGEGRGRYV
jgi:putative membrane protein